ncbi:MAG TPA: OmpA family protein [Acidocella sp.]|nr:OmpA family protein [Acidocella sp.]
MSRTPPPAGKKPKKTPNHERWVISYADLLTLLLATFVVLYASSTRNKYKLDEEAASFVKAFHGTPPSVVTSPSADRGVMQHQPSPIPRPVAAPASANSKIARQMAHQLSAEILSLQKLQTKLTGLMQPLVDKHEVSIHGQPLTLTIQLDSSVLFPSGEATLKPPAVTLLKQVAAGLTELPAPFTIAVQGYTDDQPIDTPQFPSNWSLSAERAVSVVALFWSEGVNGNQLAAQGFGQFSPAASNATDAGRAQNRRVVIVVHSPDPDLK